MKSTGSGNFSSACLGHCIDECRVTIFPLPCNLGETKGQSMGREMIFLSKDKALASFQSESQVTPSAMAWHPDQIWEAGTVPQWVVFSGINFLVVTFHLSF